MINKVKGTAVGFVPLHTDSDLQVKCAVVYIYVELIIQNYI